MVSQRKVSKNEQGRGTMIDFTNANKKKKTYAGANGSKISVTYNNEQYMLKFPSPATRKTDMSYANSCISEYIGCKIFKSIGIPVQEVLLGTYSTESNKKKLVVACKDFAINGLVIQDFASLKNQIIDSERNGYSTELKEILSTFENQTAIDSKILSERFWDMFIVDALIGNWDRHNGNWGFLYNSTTDELTLAPVFDCGSSLFPQADEDTIREALSNQGQINDRVFNRPTSAIVQNGKRINYFQLISSCENQDCNEALKRIEPRIDMTEIEAIIDNTPVITNDHKLFLKTIVKARNERIIDYSYSKLCQSEKQQTKSDHSAELKNFNPSTNPARYDAAILSNTIPPKNPPTPTDDPTNPYNWFI